MSPRPIIEGRRNGVRIASGEVVLVESAVSVAAAFSHEGRRARPLVTCCQRDPRRVEITNKTQQTEEGIPGAGYTLQIGSNWYSTKST